VLLLEVAPAADEMASALGSHVEKKPGVFVSEVAGPEVW
jgi:hypothetical protein